MPGPSETQRLREAAQWLALEVVARPEEFYAAHHPGGDMLLTALRTNGLARDAADGVTLTRHAQRMMAAEVREGRAPNAE